MPYFGNKLLNPSISFTIKHNSSTSHAIYVLELCLIAKKIEGFKSLLPKYGMRCT
jgi:hypothetical protein